MQGTASHLTELCLYTLLHKGFQEEFMLISSHLRPAYSKTLEPGISKQLQSREVPQAAPP